MSTTFAPVSEFKRRGDRYVPATPWARKKVETLQRLLNNWERVTATGVIDLPTAEALRTAVRLIGTERYGAQSPITLTALPGITPAHVAFRIDDYLAILQRGVVSTALPRVDRSPIPIPLEGSDDMLNPFGGMPLGFSIMDLLNPAGAIADKIAAQKQRESEVELEKAKIMAQAVGQQCPPGSAPNPSWTSLPPEVRAQAAAQGVQACIPSGDAAGVGKTKVSCRFVVGGQLFPCTGDGFARALAIARQYAASSQMPSLIMRLAVKVGDKVVARKTVSLAAAVMPSGQVQYPAGAIPATPAAGAPGAFTCPSGLEVARDASGNVVCAPPGTASVAARAPRASRARARGTGRSRLRSRGSRALRDFVEIDGIGGTHYAIGDYDTTRSKQIILLQQALIAAGFALKVTGEIDNATVKAVNKFYTSIGRPPITVGELLTAGSFKMLIAQIAQSLSGLGASPAITEQEGTRRLRHLFRLPGGHGITRATRALVTGLEQGRIAPGLVQTQARALAARLGVTPLARTVMTRTSYETPTPIVATPAMGEHEDEGVMGDWIRMEGERARYQMPMAYYPPNSFPGFSMNPYNRMGLPTNLQSMLPPKHRMASGVSLAGLGYGGNIDRALWWSR